MVSTKKKKKKKEEKKRKKAGLMYSTVVDNAIFVGYPYPYNTLQFCMKIPFF